MKSSRRHRRRNRGRLARVNCPASLIRRQAKADARREAIAATLPPAYLPPAPLSHWQTITIELLVPTCGRCDQHAVTIDSERMGLLSATEIGRRVAAAIRKRPSLEVQAEVRRDEWRSALPLAQLIDD
jgi:hypothetical protein